MKRHLPAFSVILTFVVLSIVGILSIPLLNIQYEPEMHRKSMSVSWKWKGASPALVEQEVTSVMEGLAASISNVGNIRSYSGKGEGYVSFELKKQADPDMVRFELSSMLRRYADKLPEGVTGLEISGTGIGTQERPIMVYSVMADLPSQMIARLAEEELIPAISALEGVRNVELTGITDFRKTILFDPEKLASAGMTVNDALSAIHAALEEDRIAGSLDGKGILLSYGNDASAIEDIPIHKNGDRIYRLSDIAVTRFEEQEAVSHYRINGKNTVNMIIYAGEGVNVIRLSDRIKEAVLSASASFPETYRIEPVKDDSGKLKDELRKIYIRTGLSLLILMLFVLLTSKSIRYLTAISISLAANILIAILFYTLFGVSIQIYSLAGITVSFGMMIDASIIMAAHYCYYRNRKAFHSILAAQLTTIGALGVVFLLPDNIRNQLSDFAAVIMINLAVSLVISVLLIPALSDTLGLKENRKTASMARRKKTVRFNRLYERYITSGKKWRWASVVLLVLVFGLPFSELPDRIGKEPYNTFERTYNAVFGSEYFQNRLKDPLGRIFGGSIRLFLERSSMYFGRMENKPSITIRATLPDGCTVSQMNETIRDMEEYLASYAGQIENFETSIRSASDASITISFPESVAKTEFPVILKRRIIYKAMQLGGASWSVYGIDNKPFSNNLAGGYKSESFSISGYNLDKLYGYAQASIRHLSTNPRITDPVISASQWYTKPVSEMFIDFDREYMANSGLSALETSERIKTILYSGTAGIQYDEKGYGIPVVLESSRKNDYDTWNLENEYFTGKNGQFRFGSFGTVTKREAPASIYKTDQQYTLNIAYDFTGDRRLAQKIRKAEIDRLNESVLPVGYKAYSSGMWNLDRNDTIRTASLMGLVVLIIFFITGIMFESLKIPFAVIGLIPASFSGLFLTFALFRIPFDMGGMASMVMLSGLAVNAAFYMLNEYYRQASRRDTSFAKAYTKAFNFKITPILLTVLSTFLGLLPFLLDGPEEAFWFPFAAGTMGGLLFSIPALVFLFPIWLGGIRKH